MEIIISEILKLVKKKMREQGAYSFAAYRQFVTETINYFKEKGKLTDDDNEKFIEDRLIDLWSHIKKEFEDV